MDKSNIEEQFSMNDFANFLKENGLFAEFKNDYKAKKNKDFTQVYNQGWNRIADLLMKNPKATKLYAFLAKHIDYNCGAVICEQSFLAEQLNVTVRTIYNWIIFLEKEKALLKIKISGNLYAYALNPEEIWKGYDDLKPYAVFNTKTLLRHDKQIKKRIETMFSKSQKINFS